MSILPIALTLLKMIDMRKKLSRNVSEALLQSNSKKMMVKMSVRNW